MMSSHSLEFIIATLLVFQFASVACANGADTMGVDNDALVKFDSFVDDLRAAFNAKKAALTLVPCWKDFRCTDRNALDVASRASRAYTIQFVAIGVDRREICFSEAHPSWPVVASIAAARELSLFAAEGRVWAEYAG